MALCCRVEFRVVILTTIDSLSKERSYYFVLSVKVRAENNFRGSE